MLGSVFLAGLMLASAIGLWRRTARGWWIVAFYYVYGVARNLWAFVVIAGAAEGLEDAQRGLGYYLTKHGVRAGIHLLVLLYLFQPHVLAYFELRDLSKGAAIGKLLGACALIGAAATVLSFVAG